MNQFGFDGDEALMSDQAGNPQAQMLEKVLVDGMSPADERAAIEQCVRDKPSLAVPLLFTVLEQKHRCRRLLEQTTRALSEAPWHPAVFLALSSDGARALVASGGRRVSVAVAPEVDAHALRCGRAVFLNAAQNVLTEVAPDGPRPGAVGEFSRLHGTRQAVIRSQAEEELVVDLAAPILEQKIRRGDLVLYDRESYVAFETLERPERSDLVANLPLDVRIEQLGGLQEVFDELVMEVTLHLFRPDLVRRYALQPIKGVLLCGPPGTGKTSLVRALGEHLARTMGVDVKALLVPPGSHRSMWFGASEQRVRDLFRQAREAAERDRYVLLFFDDMDHLGSRDHRLAGEIDARLLPSFLQEIDDVRTDRLLLLGATNREDLLDEALLRPGRFGKTFRIGRPTRGQAREILRCYLTRDLPIADDGRDRPDAVRGIVEDLLAALYAPNGEFARLAMLTFRDGSRQPLRASQILSGAVIAAAIERGKRRGCVRALNGGPGAVDLDDLRTAMRGELSAICERLKPGPALQHMLDLPPDRDVVKVEPCRPDELPRASEYLHAAAIQEV
jgi:proteasome-associated ATPase